MIAKKTNESKTFENAVRTRVRGLVNEALATLAPQLEEAGAEVNPVFNKVTDKDALIKWLMGYYFKPERKGEVWWSKKVNPKNILAYISNQANHFPLTPREVVDDWNIKKSLKGDLGSIRDDDVEAFEKNEPEAAVYNTGEKPLKTIGKEMGGLTAAMINKIEKSGMEHFLKTVAGKNPVDMSEDELDELLQKVDDARLETSFEFARDLKAAKNNIKLFVASLVKKQILSPTDVKLMKPREIEMLLFLMNKPEDQVAEYLRGDAQKVDNRIKSFQAAVARKLYPAGKRGRPRLAKPTE